MKLFKKLAAVCMAGVMALSLVACGGASLETGYYKLSSMKEGETEYDEAQLSELGVDNYMVVEEGGKGYMNMMGDEKEFTWDDKNITVDNEPAGYTFSDGTITINQEEVTMVFKKSTETAPARGAGAAATEESADEAEGTEETETTEETEATEETEEAAE